MPALANPKHEAFALEYVDNGRNASAAYRKLYPEARPASAWALGSRLLRNVIVEERIAELTGEQLSAAEYVFRAAQEYAVEVIEGMMSMWRSAEIPHPLRVRCGEIILERGLGKPLQQVSVQTRITYVIEAPSVATTFDTWAGAPKLIEAFEPK